jgi:hypothetical protein
VMFSITIILDSCHCTLTELCWPETLGTMKVSSTKIQQR